ncbi:uncharacterized protein LOC141900210 isoform X2 [Tubulanus polymorphus]|uniref:uncharacterized protein LOC141900210 isoform X2 n=1 Tax=Tubulanus polymorphus TaxID=672921 RepID=UPI003DA4E98F
MLMAMQDVISPDEEVFRKKAETLENQLKSQTSEMGEIKDELSKKSKKLSMLEQQLRAQEKKHSDEKQLLKNKVRGLQSELECKSNNIAVLTHQLHAKKDHRSSPSSDQPVVLKPAPPKDSLPSGSASRRRLNLKRNVITIPPEKRRPNSASVDSELSSSSELASSREFTSSKDSALSAPFLFQKRDVTPEVKVKVHPIKQPLPPIGGSLDSIDADESSLTWAVRDLTLRGSSPKQEILAVDHADVWRKSQKYKSAESK